MGRHVKLYLQHQGRDVAVRQAAQLLSVMPCGVLCLGVYPHRLSLGGLRHSNVFLQCGNAVQAVVALVAVGAGLQRSQSLDLLQSQIDSEDALQHLAVLRLGQAADSMLAIACLDSSDQVRHAAVAACIVRKTHE